MGACTCKIVTKHNEKHKERKLCRLFIIFLLWDMQQVYGDLWVHPLNEERSQKGKYYTHYTDHRLFDDRFFELYRMTVAQFDEILHKIQHLLQKEGHELLQCYQSRTKISNNHKVILTNVY